jgi:YVTN family beta-propeller protein
MTVTLLLLAVTWLGLQTAPPPAAASALDYETFKTQIEPIFLAKRPGHARCYTCHSTGTPLRLQRLSPGSVTWSEAQSKMNFEAVQKEILPGVPLKSRLLIHPLATDAGGDHFHNGGKHWNSQTDPEWQALSAWVRGQSPVATPGSAAKAPIAPVSARRGTPATAAPGARIIQTNSAGDNVTIIDPATNTVVGEISGIEVNHGAAVAPDGSRIYVSNEADSTLDVADSRTFAVTKRIPLSGHPNNIAIGKDGRRVYVAIAQAPGAVDVIDTVALTRVKSIPIKGAGHNAYVTPDGKYVVAGSVGGRSLTVIDAQSETLAWEMIFDNGVRPITFETNPDGSTKRMFVQISELHGFAVVDFATRKEVARITLPDIPGAKKNIEGVQGSPSHGIGITPDGKTLWATSKWYGYVFAYSMPDLKLLGSVAVGMDPDWLTFTPDSKSVYVACAGSNHVSVVDVKSVKEVTRIPVGEVPKRNITAILP